MIKFNFKLNKDTISATVPEGWHEVKLKHVLALETGWNGESTDMVGLLSALTGEDYNDLENAKGDLWNPLFKVLGYVFEAPDWKRIKKPKSVTLGSKVLKPPTNLLLECFGQKVLALNLITTETDQINNIADVIAIYLQPAYDGKFVSDRVPDIKKMVLEMNAFEAMPYGLFFLKNLLRPKNYGLVGLIPSRKTMKNLLSLQRPAPTNYANSAT